jgi:hypothetical protein
MWKRCEGSAAVELGKDECCELHIIKMGGNFDRPTEDDACDHVDLLGRTYEYVKAIQPRKMIWDLRSLHSADTEIVHYLKSFDRKLSQAGCRTIMVLSSELSAKTRAELQTICGQATTLAAAKMSLEDHWDDLPPAPPQQPSAGDADKPKQFATRIPLLHFRGLTLGPSFGTTLVGLAALVMSARGAWTVASFFAGAVVAEVLRFAWQWIRRG